MSKHPKASRHRVPPQALELAMRPDPVDERYQAEIDASINRLEQHYRKAQKALAAAEAKAERVRQRILRLTEQQQEATRIAEHRAAEQKRATEYIDRIKTAAQRARVDRARAELDKKHREALIRRAEQRRRTQAEAKATREREQQISRSRSEYDRLLLTVEDRRRELREIERLMQAEGYGRDTKRRHIRQEAGAITIPLGATTGERPKQQPIPVFPVYTTKDIAL